MQHRRLPDTERGRRLAGLLIGLVLAVAGARSVQAQAGGEQVLQEVETAFGRGAEQVIMRHAAARIEIALFGANMLYSGAQAQLVLQNFFRDYPPRRFAFQEISRTGDNWFASGAYWHQEGDRPFRVYVRVQQHGGNEVLRSIRIERREQR